MKRIWLILALLAAVVVIAIIWYYQVAFRVVKVVPQPGTQPIAPPSLVTITFSQPLATANLDATDSNAPNNLVIQPSVTGTVTVNSNQLLFTPSQPFAYSTTYQFVLKNLTAQTGRRGRDYQFQYVIQPAPVNTSQTRRDFIKSLPYTTANFSVDYNAIDNVFMVEILSAPVDQAKADALSYLGVHGVAPPADQLHYDVVPYLSGQAGP
jgi:hypothetical protein